MAFLVVGVNFTVFLVLDSLVRPIAKRLVFGQTAQADPNGFFLRLYLERSLFGFEDCAHCSMLKIKSGTLSSRIYIRQKAPLTALSAALCLEQAASSSSFSILSGVPIGR
jgi:hypothetical protein